MLCCSPMTRFTRTPLWAQGIELENPSARFGQELDQKDGTQSYFSAFGGFRCVWTFAPGWRLFLGRWVGLQGSVRGACRASAAEAAGPRCLCWDSYGMHPPFHCFLTRARFTTPCAGPSRSSGDGAHSWKSAASPGGHARGSWLRSPGWDRGTLFLQAAGCNKVCACFLDSHVKHWFQQRSRHGATWDD